MLTISRAARMPTNHGLFWISAVTANGVEHAIVYKGHLADQRDVPVRIHSECLTSEVFGSMRCDCNDQLELALRYINDADAGLLIYLRQEGRGIGLFNKVMAYCLQDEGLDTIEANEQLGFPADMRTYEVAVEILTRLQIGSVRLLTNNPLKAEALKHGGVQITECVPLRVRPNSINRTYLETKRAKLNHNIVLSDPCSMLKKAVRDHD